MNVARLAQSTALLLVVSLVAVEVGYRALTAKQPAKVVDEAPLIRNIQKTIDTKSVDPDVLIVGSSLAYCFTYNVHRTDVAPDAEPDDKGENCAPSMFMQQLLKQSKKRDCFVQVVALPGAMTSDVYNIVDSMFRSGKKPRTVVYIAAPRDFVDRRNVAKKTALVTAASQSNATKSDTLAGRIDVAANNSGTSSASAATTIASRGPALQFDVHSWAARNISPALIRRWDMLVAHPSAELACQIMLDGISNLYEQRSALRDTIVNFTCEVLKRDKDLWSAQNHVREKQKNMTHFDRDLGDYEQRYNPPDFDKLTREGKSLQALQQACDANSARLIVVNMPLTKENKALLNADLYARYKRLLASVQSGAHGQTALVDSDKWNFERKEFLDSAHLNTVGSKRIQILLAPTISESLEWVKR